MFSERRAEAELIHKRGKVTWYPTKPCERQNEKPVPTFLSNVTVKYMIQVLQGNSVVEKNVMEHLMIALRRW